MRLEYLTGEAAVTAVPDGNHGTTVETPSPVNLTLSTEKLKDYAD